MADKKPSQILNFLKIVGMAGIVLIALTNPRSGEVLIKGLSRELKKKELKYKRSELAKSLWYLRKKKYVEIIEQNDSQVKIRITGKGIERVKKFDINNLKIQPMKTWDAKWRVVIFDIPEKNKNAREMFRNKLKELGFYMIQKSVFVCPWDCVDEIVFLRNILEINPHVSIILAEAIDEEMKLRRLFNVSTF